MLTLFTAFGFRLFARPLFAGYYAVGNEVRLYAGMAYAMVLYVAFIGKMIFYNHFHDTYNQIMRLGGKAENVI